MSKSIKEFDTVQEYENLYCVDLFATRLYHTTSMTPKFSNTNSRIPGWLLSPVVCPECHSKFEMACPDHLGSRPCQISKKVLEIRRMDYMTVGEARALVSTGLGQREAVADALISFLMKHHPKMVIRHRSYQDARGKTCVWIKAAWSWAILRDLWESHYTTWGLPVFEKLVEVKDKPEELSMLDTKLELIYEMQHLR